LRYFWRGKDCDVGRGFNEMEDWRMEVRGQLLIFCEALSCTSRPRPRWTLSRHRTAPSALRSTCSSVGSHFLDVKSAFTNNITGNFEALSRPRVESSSGAESETDAAHEPLSGIGAS